MSERISVTREQYLDSVAHLTSAAEELAARLNMTQLTWQPAGGERWSIVECLDHIAISTAINLDAMESVLGRASAGPAAGTFRTAGLPSTKFVRDLEPPHRTRFPAPRKVLPRPTLNPEGILPDYLKTMDRLSRLVRSTTDKDLNSVRFRNPLLPVCFTVATGLLIVAAHGRRHIWQAEQVTREADFPG